MLLQTLNVDKYCKYTTIPIILLLIFLFLFTSFYKGVAAGGDLKYDTMDKCLDSQCYQFGIVLFVCFCIYLLSYGFFRNYPIQSFGVIILLFISTLANIVINDTFDGVFEYVKYISISVGVIILAATRFYSATNYKTPNLLSKNSVSWVLLLILGLNIAEACYTDFKDEKYYNLIAGIILLITIPTPVSNLLGNNKNNNWGDLLGINKNNSYDFVFKTPMVWVLMYIIWNMCFSYSSRKEHFATIVVVLLTTLFSDFPNSLSNIPWLFMQCRVYTLFIRYVILGWDDVYEKYADSSNWYNEDISNYWGLINMISFIVILIYCHFNK